MIIRRFSTTRLSKRFLSAILVGVLLVVLFPLAKLVSAATVVVDDDGAGTQANCAAADAAFTTIQAAVNTAATGDTIFVCPGSYVEKVTTNKGLTFLGPQNGVDARSGRTQFSSEAAVGTTNGAFDVQLASPTDQVIIDGFTITRATAAADTPGVLLLGGANHEVRNNIITGNGRGAFFNSSGTRFFRNRLGNGTDGIFIGSGDGDSSIIESNLFQSQGSGIVTVPTATTDNLTIRDNVSIGDGNFVALFKTANSVLTSNTVISTTGSALFIGGGNTGLEISRNTITGSATPSTTSFAAAVSMSDQFGNGANTNITIVGNQFRNNERGIVVASSGAGASGLEVHYNRIVGNTNAGLLNNSSPVDAENNFWGCNTGPNTTGCDSVSGTGTTDFDPFLVLTTTAAPNTVSTGGSSTVTADLTINSDGVDTSDDNPATIDTVPNNTPVTFASSPAGGSITPSSVTTVDGKATATFTSNTNGVYTVSASVDNATDTDTVVVTDVDGTATATAAGLTATAAAQTATAVAHSATATTTGTASPLRRTVYAVTMANRLVSFPTDRPDLVTPIGIIAVPVGEQVLGIDFRPATGELFALSSGNRLYTVNLTTAVATAVGTSAFSPTLQGTAFGFDFNPMVDRIRVVSDAGQNLRLNPLTGGVVDANTTTPGTQIDGTLNYSGTVATGVVGAGYANNVAGASTTLLYVIDTTRNALSLQDPPNNGNLTEIGALGFDAENLTGFDIAQSGIAYASFTITPTSSFYTINLANGGATSVGPIGGGEAIRGLAVQAQPPVATQTPTTTATGTATATGTTVSNTATATTVPNTATATGTATTEATSTGTATTAPTGTTTAVATTTATIVEATGTATPTGTSSFVTTTPTTTSATTATTTGTPVIAPTEIAAPAVRVYLPFVIR